MTPIALYMPVVKTSVNQRIYRGWHHKKCYRKKVSRIYKITSLDVDKN